MAKLNTSSETSKTIDSSAASTMPPPSPVRTSRRQSAVEEYDDAQEEPSEVPETEQEEVPLQRTGSSKKEKDKAVGRPRSAHGSAPEGSSCSTQKTRRFSVENQTYEYDKLVGFEYSPEEFIYTTSDFKHDINQIPDRIYEILKAIIHNGYQIRLNLEASTQSFEELQGELTRALQERDEAREDFTLAQDLANRLQLRVRDQTPVQSSHASRSAKIRDPPEFTGDGTKDKLPFIDWHAAVLRKLNGNADHFSNEEGRIAYVLGLVVAPAARHTTPRSRPSAPNCYQTVSDVLEHLTSIYDNPARAREARAEFGKLEMDKGARFHTFYSEFLRLVAEGKIIDRDLVEELNEKITIPLRNAVMREYLSNPTLEDFAKYIAQVDSEKHLINVKTRANPTAANAKNPGHSNGRGISRTGTPAASTSSTPGFAGTGTKVSGTAGSTSPPGAAVTSSGADRKRPTYSDTRKQELSRLGACFHCEQPGHMTKFCPNRKINEIEEDEGAESGKEHA
jgi:hypothetical protein